MTGSPLEISGTFLLLLLRSEKTAERKGKVKRLKAKWIRTEKILSSPMLLSLIEQLKILSFLTLILCSLFHESRYH